MPKKVSASDPGVEEGEVLTTTTPEGDEVKEKVVLDYDDEGNQIGWHKEVTK